MKGIPLHLEPLVDQIVDKIYSIHYHYGNEGLDLVPKKDIKNALIRYAVDPTEFTREDAIKYWAQSYNNFGLVLMLDEVWPLMHKLWSESEKDYETYIVTRTP